MALYTLTYRCLTYSCSQVHDCLHRIKATSMTMLGPSCSKMLESKCSSPVFCPWYSSVIENKAMSMAMLSPPVC